MKKGTRKEEKKEEKNSRQKVRQTLRVAAPIGTKDGEKEVHADGTWGKPGDRYGLLLPSGFLFPSLLN